jgi:hypothetical protein
MARYQLTTLYVVEWETLGIVKVGTTILPSRVRKFVLTGATVRALFHDMTTDHERAVHRHLRVIGRRAFPTWQSAKPLLGAGGLGFTECFILDAHNRANIVTTVKAVITGAVVQD